ncbi:response regulator [Hungatella hathewayi]|nr:response regulator [Hungatella hathewayi]
MIVISGFDDYEYVHSALRYGAVDYLLKPIDPDDFSMVLQKCMRSAERTNYLKKFYNHQMGLEKLMLIQQHRVEQLMQNDKIDELVSEYAGDSVMVLQEVFRGYQPKRRRPRHFLSPLRMRMQRSAAVLAAAGDLSGTLGGDRQ